MELEPLKLVEKIAGKLAPGPTPYFMEAHVVKALRKIDAEGSVGRTKLSKGLGLSEGTTRTLIKHLRNEGLIEVSRAGISLTDYGRRLSSSLKSMISEGIDIPKSPLTVGPLNVAVLVKSAISAVRYGLEQRDAAVRVGALGATTLVFTHGKLKMPKVDEDVFRGIQAIRDTLIYKLKPKEDDVIVIGSANDKLTAELAAIAAAIQTLKARS